MNAGAFHLHIRNITVFFFISGLQLKVAVHDLQGIHRLALLTPVEDPLAVLPGKAIDKVILNKAKALDLVSLLSPDLPVFSCG